jgi:2'-5' RNA ligase
MMEPASVKPRFTRLFVAVEVDDQCRATLSGVIAELKKTGADVGWVNPANLHMTLKFLGDTAVGPDKIASALKTVSAGKFEIELRGLDAFPSLKRPRVIFAEASEGASALKNLARLVETSLENIGFEPEAREFHPHLTIGRVKSDKATRGLVEKMVGHSGEIFGRISVNRFYLVKSDLRPSGPVYTKIAEIQLY